MNSRFILLLSSINLILAQSSDQPVINTPASVPQCLPSLLQFHGGNPPYTISAIPGGQVGAPPLVELGQQSGDSLTWIANLPAGTSTTLQIRDSKGIINYSQMFTIQPNSDSSCLKSPNNPSPITPPASSSPSSTTTGTPSLTTVTVGATTPAKVGNTTAATPARSPNTTLSTIIQNGTAGMPNGNSTIGSSPNTTKGPSPFVSPTSNTSPVNNNNVNSPATSAPTNAASSISVICQPAFLTGLTFAALAVFA